MEINTNRGILYPENYTPEKRSYNGKTEDCLYYEIPHKAIKLCEDAMHDAFSKACMKDAEFVFILAPLHNGKVNSDDEFTVYSYSDCFVNHSLITKDDCVCSEEFSYEIALPFIKTYFPKAKSTAFFAPEKSNRLKDFISFVKKNYINSVFFVSNGETNCSEMWKQAF